MAASETGYAGLSLGSAPSLTPTRLTISRSASFICGGFIGYQYSKNMGAEVQYGGVGKSTDVSGNGTTVNADALYKF
jgi:hypothetical protein